MSWMRPGALRSRPARRPFRPSPEGLEGRQLLATLPAGFTETQVAGGLSRPTAMEFAPDGRLFVAQQGGQLRVIKDGRLLATPFVNLSVDSAGERGLLGVAFDPAFATNQFVYVYYTVPGSPAHNRVSRFTAAGDVAAAGSEVSILDLDNLSGATNHNGGAIHFGIDGKLYVAAGENANPSHAQTLANRHGKVLRINPDGSIPSDNPFFTTATGANRAIWALGLRNPFTFAVQPGTGRIHINDVGQNTWEEINVGAAGANYGWPTVEGPEVTPDARFADPLFAFRHDDGDGACAIAGGAFYNPAVSQFPAAFAGDYFFADLCAGWIHRLDVSGNTVTEFDFASGISAPVDLKVAADGSLYYLAGSGSNAGVVFRIQGPGQGPAVTGEPSDQTVAAGQPVTFTVTVSGTAPLGYQWQRNNLNIAGATGPSFTIAATAAGDFGARYRVVVANAFGNAISRGALLSQAPPAQAPVVVSPPSNQFAIAGQPATFSVTASGTAPLAYQWQRNGINIAGATGASFTIPAVSAGDFGALYRVVVSNAAGFIASRDAVVVGPSPYVQSLYNQVLLRPADNVGLAAFSLQLAQGVPADRVAAALLASIERLELVVVRTFRVFLDRDPGRPEIDGWVGFLRAGRSETDLQATILGTPEFFARQGNTVPGFVRGLYRRILARDPSQADIDSWGALVAQIGREGVAFRILTSTESWDRVVGSLYLAHLLRPAGASERAAWVNQLQAGLTRERLEVIILTSPEYRTQFPA